MLRRIHVPAVLPGEIPLDRAQARHARDVLRLETGVRVEVFDDSGATATGELAVTGAGVAVRIDAGDVQAATRDALALTIAAAVPKGERADWMVEKLSELGVADFIPLAAARSVVLPGGKNKRERWLRIATESARQSRRSGVMRIGELTRVDDCVARLAGSTADVGWYFSTAPDAKLAGEVSRVLAKRPAITALIGPEGGWSDEEVALFSSSRLTPVRLTSTVLRVETAAIAAAAVIASLASARGGDTDPV